jgi:hypothetical protein
MAKGDQTTVQKTIDYVKPGTRTWTSPDGVVLHFITVIFADGDEGGVGNTAENIEKIRASLEELVGKSESYEVTDNGEYNNVQQWKIRQWPGKPEGLGSGRKGGGGGGMTNAQAALMATCDLFSGTRKLDADIFVIADGLKAWLDGQSGQAAPAEEQPKEKPSAEQQATLPQVRELRDLAYEIGYSPDQVAAEIGTADLASLSKSDAEAIIEAWRGKLAEAK